MKIPEELKEELGRTNEIVIGVLTWLQFCIADTARDSEFTNNHLLSFLSQDIFETLSGVHTQVKEGIHNPSIRESRYLLELSIKMAYIQQQDYALPISKKLEEVKKTIKSPKISVMNEIDLDLLSEESRSGFLKDVGKLYGKSSNFVHVTPHSINHRMEKMKNGSYLGSESREDLKELNDFLQEIYAASIVFISHSLPQYVVGDWHVDRSGGLTNWYYIQSKYIAEIDSSLDYKHERKHVLDKVISERNEKIAF